MSLYAFELPYTHNHTHMHARTRTHAQTRTHTHTHTHLHMCTHSYTLVYVFVCVRVFVRMYACSLLVFLYFRQGQLQLTTLLHYMLQSVEYAMESMQETTK